VIELEVYAGGSGVLRADEGWYAVSHYAVTRGILRFDVDTSQTVPPNALDQAIVWRADELLPSVARWNRNDNRKCPRGATAVSIYCAMQQATIEVTCGANHRRPAMEVVRVIVDKRSANRNYQHRLMEYNNDSTTTLGDVRSLFREALSRMHAPDRR